MVITKELLYYRIYYSILNVRQDFNWGKPKYEEKFMKIQNNTHLVLTNYVYLFSQKIVFTNYEQMKRHKIIIS